jgi:hypothetical protein
MRQPSGEIDSKAGRAAGIGFYPNSKRTLGQTANLMMHKIALSLGKVRINRHALRK